MNRNKSSFPNLEDCFLLFLILILNKTVCFIKKAPPYGVADFIIFELENNEIPSHKFLSRLQRYKMVIKPFYQELVLTKNQKKGIAYCCEKW